MTRHVVGNGSRPQPLICAQRGSGAGQSGSARNGLGVQVSGARFVSCNLVFQVVGSVKVASLFLLVCVILRTRYTFIMRKCHLDLSYIGVLH